MNGKTVRRLIYFSSATRKMSAPELDSLLTQSRHNNLRDDLTGLLLYGDGSFMQLLEGPEDAVDHTYRRIQDDPRHRNLMKVDDIQCDARLFGRWSMGYQRVNPGDGLEGFVQLRRSVLEDSGYRSAGDLPDYMVRNFLASIPETR
ncbi:MAG: BLUF domain-containing protein [Minwuia sp.]|nr:BLUF domain-containing protein [Minwuia sp.]